MRPQSGKVFIQNRSESTIGFWPKFQIVIVSVLAILMIGITDSNAESVANLSNSYTFSTAALAQSQSFDPFEKSLEQIQNALESGETTSVELVKWYWARIQSIDKAGPRLNSYLFVRPLSDLISEATQRDTERAKGLSRGALHGIPYAAKDNFNTSGIPTTAGAIGLRDNVPRSDAEQIARLHNAGAILLGKVNLQELAMTIASVSSLGGQTRNPYNLSYDPGGSSGGSAVAVAANLAPFALGTDTGGSIRVPASYNSLVGFRSTRGKLSTLGIIPASLSFDVAGPLVKTVEDLKIVLTILQPSQFPQPDTTNVRKRLGIPRNFIAQKCITREVKSAFAASIEKLRLKGWSIVEIDDSEINQSLSTFSFLTIGSFEMAPLLDQYLKKYGTGSVRSVKQFLSTPLFGITYLTYLASDVLTSKMFLTYIFAQSFRDNLRRTTSAILNSNNIEGMIYPTNIAPTGRAANAGRRFLAEAASVVFETASNSSCDLEELSPLTSFPAISIPSGYMQSTGLPVGIEIIGAEWADSLVIEIGQQVERDLQSRFAPPSL